MIPYHGTPISGDQRSVLAFLQGRHALVPFLRPDHLHLVAEACQSFVFDNSAFSIWKRGATVDFEKYLDWCSEWYRHPGFSWAMIPDVIDGTENENDALIKSWPREIPGVPVWHLHESLHRLYRLSHEWPTVALGSSGQWSNPGTRDWWERMREAMTAVCDQDGRPRCKLHGLRMLSPKIFEHLPLASADSTNAGRNASSTRRFGMYVPPTAGQRAAVIANRVERHQAASRFDWGDDPPHVWEEQAPLW